MIQECYLEPRVLQVDGKVATSLAGVGATRQRCCQVAVARGGTRLLQAPAAKGFAFCVRSAETFTFLLRSPKLPCSERRTPVKVF